MNGIPQIFPAPSGGAITGEIRAFVGSLPFGWLECDGSAFDAAKYPRLKTVLGAETLPDLRDASLRGATASSAANTKSGQWKTKKAGQTTPPFPSPLIIISRTLAIMTMW
ncbi:MAG: hypothetical protein BHW65_04480 [Verrucomicrobia bacterium CAG:312_58_20]|nr:MAG: hypothetical protein BHW65_04480 [Verrucomicrobia bacterium CAG:312_58_20]